MNKRLNSTNAALSQTEAKPEQPTNIANMTTENDFQPIAELLMTALAAARDKNSSRLANIIGPANVGQIWDALDESGLVSATLRGETAEGPIYHVIITPEGERVLEAPNTEALLEELLEP